MAHQNGRVGVGQVGWMVGKWVEESGGVRTEEFWRREGEVLVGEGRRIRAGAVVFTEALRVEVRGGCLMYVARPEGEGETGFGAVEVVEGGEGREGRGERVVFENLGHDFPTRIAYWKEGEVMVAEISGMREGKARSRRWMYRSVEGGM